MTGRPLPRHAVAGPVPSRGTPEIDDFIAVLAAWPIGAVLALATPPDGASNDTRYVEADAGSYFLRVYRRRTRPWIEAEHAVIARVRERGLPAPPPLPLPGGDTILERKGRHFALFPRLAGERRSRGDLSPAEAMAAGAALGRVHAALRDHTDDRLWRRPYALDRAATLARIDELERLVRARPHSDPSDRWALDRLAGQRRRLQDLDSDDLILLDALDRQPLHGDYQETNLLFADGQVAAVLDWESTHVGVRLLEVLRALELMFDLGPQPCRAFLAGYRTIAPLDPGELEAAAVAWGRMQAHNLFLYEALYVDGNERLRRFLRPGGFRPVEERWAAVADAGRQSGSPASR